MAFIATAVTAVSAAITVTEVATVLTAVSAVGAAMSVVGMVTGSKELTKIGGVLGVVGGVGSLAAGAMSAAGGAVAEGGEALGGAGGAMGQAGDYGMAADGASDAITSSVPSAADGISQVGQAADSAANVGTNVNQAANTLPQTSAQMPSAATSTPTPAQPTQPLTGGPADNGNTFSDTQFGFQTSTDPTLSNPATKSIGEQFGSAMDYAKQKWDSLDPRVQAELAKSVLAIPGGIQSQKNKEAELAIQQQKVNQTSYGSQVPTFGIINKARAG